MGEDGRDGRVDGQERLLGMCGGGWVQVYGGVYV